MDIELTCISGDARSSASLAVLWQDRLMGSSSDTVIIATGATFTDALSVSPEDGGAARWSRFEMERIAGEGHYGTSVAVASYASGCRLGFMHPVAASNDTFPDMPQPWRWAHQSRL